MVRPIGRFTGPPPRLGSSLLQVANEPLRRERSDFFQCAWFFKQMRCSRNDRQFFFALELATGFFIELDDTKIVTAYDENCRSVDLCKLVVSG